MTGQRRSEGPPPPPDAAAVPARAAANVVLVRSGCSGLQVYMLQRSSRMAFAPGALVFPGGTVDDSDRARTLLQRAPRFDPAATAGRMQLDGPAGVRLCAAYHVAAVRELFEETGVLLGQAEGEGALTNDTRTLLETARHDMLEGHDFLSVLEHRRLTLSPELLVYVAHFVTPLDWPRRFDARVFAAAAPPDQEPVHHATESAAGAWHHPRAVITGHDRGAVVLMPPTRVVCDRLAGCETVADVLRLGDRPLL